MSSDTQVSTCHKRRTAALMTVFGLVPAAMFACPNLSGQPRNVQDLISLGAFTGVACVALLPMVGLIVFWRIQNSQKIKQNKQDETNLLNGEQWVRWQYAPGEWQQSGEARRMGSSGSSTPWVIIGPYGVYHQISGFNSIRNLRGVNFQPPTETSDSYYYGWGNMSRLEFVLNDTYSTGTRYGGFGGYKKVQVGVPHGKEAEVVAIMNRFISERLQGRNG